MLKLVINIVIVVVMLYFFSCMVLYLFQEKLLFFPQKLDKDFKYDFEQEIEEINIKTEGGNTLNAVLFKASKPKGLIFYLHGNSGSVNSWGAFAKFYNDLNYDVLMYDYRGFGKSDISLKGQEDIYEDAQVVYNEIKNSYPENDIIVLGYSLGTGPAVKVAANNHPKLLILQAPYYSIADVMQHSYPFLPGFILRYKMESNKWIAACKMPIIIFHGKMDEVIYYESATKLQALAKNNITLIPLENQTHNGITDNFVYRKKMEEILGSIVATKE